MKFANLTTEESALLQLFRRTGDGARPLSTLSLAAHLRAAGCRRTVEDVAGALVAKSVLRPVGDLSPGQLPSAYALTESGRTLA